MPQVRYIMLLIACFMALLVFAQNSNKRISIDEKNITVEKAFKMIENQTGYSIAYGQSKLNHKKKISLSLKNANVDEALTLILKDSKHSYKIKGYHIIISPNTDKKKEEEKEKPTQTIRGTVVDSRTGIPIEHASVGILGYLAIGVITDSLGRFSLKKVPVGRCDMQVSIVGYETNVIREVLVTSFKEVQLEIPVIENMQLLREIVVRPEINKKETLNKMALTGGRLLSMEEAGRFANGFDDPARLVSAFAGVAGDVGSNAVSIRGNAPHFSQWRLEGVEVSNPTHFADITGLGGGVLSALNNQLIGNSDFYNGAFPAEYSNAISGIFDMHIRNGNNQKYEHAISAGVLGMDLISEGPLSKKTGSSYIINYRDFNTMFISGENLDADFQDLSFKLNFPTAQKGTFSVWAVGLTDKYKYDGLKKESEWVKYSDRQESNSRQYKAMGGFTHKYIFDHNTYLKSSFTGDYTRDKIIALQKKVDGDETIVVGDVRNKNWSITLNSYLNKRLSANHVNRTGLTLTGMGFDLDYNISSDIAHDKPMGRIAKGNGGSAVISAYSTSLFELNRNLSASVGLSALYFNFNRNFAIEPRLALKWKPEPGYTLAIAYGLHSRRERFDYYCVEKEIDGVRKTNKNLDFTRAHHFGLSFDWNISPILHLKIEPYYQHLYDIPVENNTSFSMINHSDFYLDRILHNKGKGMNYGIDLTFEQYLNKGFYYMFTASLFKSEYKGGDNIWRDTRLDRSYIFNLLAGKEWMVGKHKQNVFSMNARVFLHGGNRYTPVDEAKSHESKDIEFDETRAYSEKFNPGINGDISASYKINKQRLSHEFSLKVLNVAAETGIHFYEYHENIDKIERVKGMGIIPNLSYKIQF